MWPRPPTATQIAWSALISFALGILAITLLEGFAGEYPLRLLQGIAVGLAGALVVAFIVALVTGRLADWRNPRSERDFEALVQRTEQLARDGLSGEAEDDLDDGYDDDDDEPVIDPWNEEDFKALVRAALDELPLEFHRALEHVAVVVEDRAAPTAPTASTTARPSATTASPASSSSATRSCATSATTSTCCAPRSSAPSATSSPTTSAGTRTACAGWGCSRPASQRICAGTPPFVLPFTAGPRGVRPPGRTQARGVRPPGT